MLPGLGFATGFVFVFVIGFLEVGAGPAFPNDHHQVHNDQDGKAKGCRLSPTDKEYDEQQQ
jgi:hypothetical protein